jgi:hypothetical protein
MTDTHVNLKLTTREVQRLRLLARNLGFTIGRGPRAVDGSIRQLVRAVAAGDLEIVQKEATAYESDDV